MQIARVIGDVSSTQKHPSHEGRKLLLVQPLDLDGSDRGTAIVAVDGVNAGIGDRVLLVQDGFAAFSTLGLKPSPIDSAVIGVIDRVDLDPAPEATPEAPPPAAKKAARKSRAS